MTRRAVIEPGDVDGGFVVLDARPAEAFAVGTRPGAAHVPVAEWERDAKTVEGSLAEPAFWAARIGALGIDGARPVAVFDDGRMTEAARVWFILQHFGIDARVVNGGWPALAKHPGSGVASGGPPPAPRAFVSMGRGAVRLVTKQELRQAVGTDVQILDARARPEFTGEDRRDNPRGGHLPGAHHLAHADLLNSNGRLLDRPLLVALLTRAGVRVGAPLITHCQGGGRAALAALAAVEASFSEVGVYYLSFAEWARDESCPVELLQPEGA